MHRDISAGNILIYPCVMYDEDAKTIMIVWVGILGDWELAKYKSLMKGRQPERTVSRAPVSDWSPWH